MVCGSKPSTENREKGEIERIRGREWKARATKNSRAAEQEEEKSCLCRMMAVAEA